MTPRGFYDAYITFAVASEAATNVPALFTMAQAALESAWGLHAPGNNFFGIKDTDGINGNEQIFHTHEVVHGKRIAVDAAFRKYPTPADGFIDHGNFLVRNKRYAPAFKTKDPSAFADAVAAAGYATDPNYADKIKKIINIFSSFQ